VREETCREAAANRHERVGDAKRNVENAVRLKPPWQWTARRISNISIVAVAVVFSDSLCCTS
jgi:hypothetical protein